MDFKKLGNDKNTTYDYLNPKQTGSEDHLWKLQVETVDKKTFDRNKERLIEGSEKHETREKDVDIYRLTKISESRHQIVRNNVLKDGQYSLIVGNQESNNTSTNSMHKIVP